MEKKLWLEDTAFGFLVSCQAEDVTFFTFLKSLCV